MNFKVLLLAFWFAVCTSSSYAETGEGLNVTYKVPLLPLKINFSSSGIKFTGSKSVVTPIGSFDFGYSKFAPEFRNQYGEDYTYVVITDMNQMKEHVYKVKDKQTLRLINEGVTNVEIENKRVEIRVEKGSTFSLSFSVNKPQKDNYSKTKQLTGKQKNLVNELNTKLLNVEDLYGSSNGVTKKNYGFDSYSCSLWLDAEINKTPILVTYPLNEIDLNLKDYGILGVYQLTLNCRSGDCISGKIPGEDEKYNILNKLDHLVTTSDDFIPRSVETILDKLRNTCS